MALKSADGRRNPDTEELSRGRDIEPIPLAIPRECKVYRLFGRLDEPDRFTRRVHDPDAGPRGHPPRRISDHIRAGSADCSLHRPRSDRIE